MTDNCACLIGDQLFSGREVFISFKYEKREVTNLPEKLRALKAYVDTELIKHNFIKERKIEEIFCTSIIVRESGRYTKKDVSAID